VKIIVRVSMTLVALSAAALSFQSLMRLGELCGYGSLAFLYPIVLDLGAASSCAAWLHMRSRQALKMTWGLLGCSVVLNGTVHYLDATYTGPSWLLVVAVAAMPPTVLGLCVHLAVGLGDPPVAAVVNHPTVSDEDPVSELIESGVGRRKLAEALNVSEYRARRLLAERSEVAQ